MHIPMTRLILSRMAVSLGIIAPMVAIDDGFYRLIIGGVLFLFIMPVAAWFATHQTLKIGKEAGKTQLLADILREHVRLNRDNPG